jgi:RWD domain
VRDSNNSTRRERRDVENNEPLPVQKNEFSNKMFAALQYSSSSDDDDGNADDIVVPDYEDLSSNRADEVTVLEAVYGSDFTVDDDDGAWHVRAMDQGKHHSLILRVQPNKRYPYAVPRIAILSPKNASGGTSSTTTKLRDSEMQQLQEQLQTRARELAETGSVMMIELVQVRTT